VLVTFVQGIIKEEVAAAKSRLGGRRPFVITGQRKWPSRCPRRASAQAMSVSPAPRPLIAGAVSGGFVPVESPGSPALAGNPDQACCQLSAVRARPPGAARGGLAFMYL